MNGSFLWQNWQSACAVSRDRVVGKWSFKTFLRVDHKTTPNWAWPGLSDPISKYLGPLITGKTSKANYSYITKQQISTVYLTTIVTRFFDENDFFILLESSIPALQDGYGIFDVRKL